MTALTILAGVALALAAFIAAMVFVFDVVARREDKPTDSNGREP